MMSRQLQGPFLKETCSHVLLAAHVHHRGPERDGNPAGSQEKDRKVCQGKGE